MTDWQPIETAPQDGQARLYLIRIEGDDEPAAIVAADFGKWLVSTCGASWTRTWATHWASLPELPEGWML